MALKWLDLADFADVISRHNTEPVLNPTGATSWRTLVSKKAKELTNFLLDYPTAARTSVHSDKIYNAFSKGLGDPDARGNASSFDRWVGWWNGTWVETDKPQYHIWDETVSSSSGDQWIQPVSQSETYFTARKPFDNWAGCSGKYDLAINVWSSKWGITGWVSKPKYKLELPHIGYALSKNTLVWITNAGGTFFMYLEQVATDTKGTTTYDIFGRTFTLTPAGGDDYTFSGGMEDKKKGSYSLVMPSTVKVPASGKCAP